MLSFKFSNIIAISAIVFTATQSTDAFAKAGCFQPPALLQPQAIASFISDPSALLSANPQGGIQMSTQIRALAGSDSDAVDAALALGTTANADQKAAIGAGLARAAISCVAVDPKYAAEIQQKVAASPFSEVLVAFQSASDDTATASLGAAGGAAGGAAAGGISGTGGVVGGSGGTSSETPTKTAAETAATIRNFSVSGAGQSRRTVLLSVSQT